MSCDTQTAKIGRENIRGGNCPGSEVSGGEFLREELSEACSPFGEIVRRGMPGYPCRITSLYVQRYDFCHPG